VKRLVICFDGTWRNADSDDAETNVALMARAVHANVDTNGVPQLVLYLRGVGSTGMLAQRLVEGAVGLGVDDNIRSGYMFLAQNYVPGDEIFFFGFSRGAFTARSLSGLIASCELLKRQRLGDVSAAWSYYRTVKKRSPEDFVRRHNTDTHLDATIKFLGVWDTVGALGIPTDMLNALTAREYAFHDTSPSRVVLNGFQALAVDEFRDEFVPTLWTGDPPTQSRIEQVWFAGAHSDVGGGYVDRGLADIPLRWMADQAIECATRSRASPPSDRPVASGHCKPRRRVRRHALAGRLDASRTSAQRQPGSCSPSLQRGEARALSYARGNDAVRRRHP
jgi:uncharacterized protein (DUF2235 family)